MSGMMDSTGEVVALMIVLVLVLGGVLVGVRLVGAKAFNRDHDGTPRTVGRRRR